MLIDDAGVSTIHPNRERQLGSHRQWRLVRHGMVSDELQAELAAKLEAAAADGQP
jgi:hypothetical protein